jgi:ceramide glucosyltransferase
MVSGVSEFIPLFAAAIPFVYYLIALYSAIRYFTQAKNGSDSPSEFTPPVSNLKPVRGLDPEAYENFASLCRQDYPEYELIFCVTDLTDPCVPVIHKLIRDFPDRKIRLLCSAGHTAINDKVAKLRLMEREAQYETLVINDSDVRVDPGYLRRVVAPLADPRVGGVTCFYVSAHDRSFVEYLQTVGMLSDFYAGVLVAWLLDGVHFALGPTMVSTKQRVADFGGFQALENRPGDDLLFGRLIAEQGYEMKLLPSAVETVPDFKGTSELIAKRLRWMTVMRNMRTWGHFGLIFTFGLPWAILAILIHPTVTVAAVYLGGYAVFRAAITWLIGAQGLKQSGVWKKMALIPFWDALAFLIWLASFTRSSIRWRGVTYQLKNGQFVSPNQALATSSYSPTKSDS